MGRKAPKSRRVEVNRLIAAGKHREALSLARDAYGRSPSPTNETLLADAYAARIDGLYAAGLVVEARGLADIARESLPAAAQRIDEKLFRCVAEYGAVEDLLSTGLRTDLSEKQRRTLDDALKRRLADPEELARSRVLPADHPLKRAGEALWKAFTAVTVRPVEDREISLAGISRRSPLAPWKHLVRAIACFYRGDGASCERHLAAIDPQSRPARLVPQMRAMLVGDAPQHSEIFEARLRREVGGIPQELHDACELLDDALSQRPWNEVRRRIRNAVEICGRTLPGFLAELRQRASIQSALRGFDSERMRKAMGDVSVKDARFWRLLASVSEQRGWVTDACSKWECFRRHAVHEGLLAPGGKEEATLYLHMATLLGELPPRQLSRWAVDTVMRHHQFDAAYEGHPGFVSTRDSGDGARDERFFSPGYLYKQACALDPHPETFRSWFEWSASANRGHKAAAEVAELWSAALPGDPEPILHLMDLAEKRKAYKKALGYLGRAESADRLNPRVRKARFRIEVATLKRHLCQRKAHLADRDVARIVELPAAAEGDRPAFVAALRWVEAAIAEGSPEELAELQEEVSERMGGALGGCLVVRAAARMCGLPESVWPPLDAGAGEPGVERRLASTARACALGREMGLRVEIPQSWVGTFSNELSSVSKHVDVQHLRALAEQALEEDLPRLASAAAGAGIRRGGPAAARFLLLRALSLRGKEWERSDECLEAAIELARRQGDRQLFADARRLRAEAQGVFLMGMLEETTDSMTAEDAEKILARERDDGGTFQDSGGRRSRPRGGRRPRRRVPVFADDCEEADDGLDAIREDWDRSPPTSLEEAAEALASVLPGTAEFRKQFVDMLMDRAGSVESSDSIQDLFADHPELQAALEMLLEQEVEEPASKRRRGRPRRRKGKRS